MQDTQEHPAAAATLGPGAVLAGRYHLGTILGRGGMADVLAALDTALGRDVAVKLFRPETAAATDQSRSTGETRVLAALRHPGLVTLYDAGTANPDTLDCRPFLVMELVSGPTLAQELARGPLPPSLVAELGAQLAQTLAYVHANGVVHRDVKPANILLDQASGASSTWRAKLTDFGVARMIDSTRMTQAGMTVGTANYLSPEQATGQDVGPATDVYALGLVLLECLTGRIAFPGSGVAAAAARLHRDPEVPGHVEACWRDLLTAMTRRDPTARPAAGVVAASLREMAADTVPVGRAGPAGIEARPTRLLPAIGSGAPPAPAGRRHRRRRSLLLLAGTAAACLVAALVLAFSAGGTPAAPAQRPPAPAYPSVSGSMGSLLHTLENLVGP